MREEDILMGSLMEEGWLTLEQVAAACAVEPGWLMSHLDEGLFPHAESVAGVWRFSGPALLRARRMRQLERDFDAVPELAALVADLLEEMDALRARLRCGGSMTPQPDLLAQTPVKRDRSNLAEPEC